MKLIYYVSIRLFCFNIDVFFEIKVTDFLLDFDVHLYKDNHRIFITEILVIPDIIQPIDYSFKPFIELGKIL